MRHGGLGHIVVYDAAAGGAGFALPPYTPNLDNGKTMFNIGGCASCHAVPNDDPDKVDRLRLGGGLALKSPFGTFYVPNISPDPQRRHRRLERSEFRHGAVEGHVAARQQSVPGISLHLLSAHAAQRCARSLCLSENAAAGSGQIAPARSVVSVQPAPAARRLETVVFPRRPVSSPIRRNQRNGIAAPIWSMGPATAPNATVRAMLSAASSTASALPAARRRTAKAGCRTSRRRTSARRGR